MSNIYIIGYRAVGKTVASEDLARTLNKKVVHMDDELVNRIGKIDVFVRNFGWNAFRNKETELLIKLAQQENLIVDCGGGVVVRDENIEIMKKTGKVILLKANVNTISNRLEKDKTKSDQRPSLTGNDVLEEIKDVLNQRLHLYKKASDHEIDTENKSPKLIAEEIIKILENKTKVCVAVTAETVEQVLTDLNSAEQKTDLIELRIDFIKDINEKKLEQILKAKTKQIIVTCRPITFKGNEKKRIELLRKAIDLNADFVDIEFKSESVEDLIKNRKQTKIIVSHHDFEKTPNLNNLEEIYKKISSFNPDLIKIVTMANSINDCFTIFELLKGRNNLITLCMGIRGHISRVLAPKFGSLVTYAALNKESAPGQISIEEMESTYNISKINKDTTLLGVIGEHAEKSKSKFMHNTNFKDLGLNFVYVPLKVRKTELKEFMANFRKFEFKGGAVTVPHKQEIVNQIKELDETAKKIGATNTLVEDNNKITGFNTDFVGGVDALKEKTELRNKKVLVIGAGGGARAVVFGLKQEDAKITITNRTHEKAVKLAQEFEVNHDKIENMKNLIENNDIILNTTSVGMNPNVNESVIKKEDLIEGKLVMDIVYTPIETKLVKIAKEKNCQVITGERMLIYQAIGQFKKWTGIKPKFKLMEKALLDNL